jgi:hypothetical protein
VFVTLVAGAWGQSSVRGPYLGYAYPAGGQQGQVVRLVVGGQILRGADEVIVTGAGVQGRVVEYVRPLSQNELGDTAWYLRELVRRRWSLRVMREAARQSEPRLLPDHPWLRDLEHKSLGDLIRLRNVLYDPRQQPNAQIADQVNLELTIAPGAPPGDRELRLVTPGGLTNPVRFQVDVLPEVVEQKVTEPTPVTLDLPVLINGQIMPGEVDRYSLRARRGQQLVFRLQARHLTPYLADAVPGWFQATLALRDPEGREIAFADDYHFDPDPVLIYRMPQDGVYQLEVRDSIYRGREDFVYRLAVGELPFITRIFPLGAQAGVATEATVAGYHLPATKVKLDTRPGEEALREVRLTGGKSLSNAVPYAVTNLPESLEIEPNNTPAAAQAIIPPQMINGRISQPGQVDYFRVTGKAGEELVAEVIARRLHSPLDSVLRLLDAAGQVIASNDDHNDPASALLTHQADSYLRVKLPQDGVYVVALADATGQGSEAHAYRLRLGPPQPDFALRLTPPSLSLGGGRTARFTVHVLRLDGFAGEIDLSLREAPEGYTLSPTRLPADKETLVVTMQAPRSVSRQVLALQLAGQARVGETVLTRPAVPAEDMMQAFAYRHLVPRQALLLAVPGSRRVPAVWQPLLPGVQVAANQVLRIPLGERVAARLQAPAQLTLPGGRQVPTADLRFELGNRPRGITLAGNRVTAGGLELFVKADGIIARPGDAGNLLVEAYLEQEVKPEPGLPAGRRHPVRLGVLPALSFEVTQR